MTAKIFIKRTIVAFTAVICFTLNSWTDFSPVKWIGMIFYFVCFAMYLKTLYLALFKMKKVTADLLVVTVMIVSLLAGQILSGALVAWFISMGLAISFTIIERTGRKIAALTRETNKVVRVVRDGIIKAIPIDQVCPGDEVVVPQGEMIPVDGVITEGASSIDESVITGEPFALFKQTGDCVTSGSITTTSQLKIKAEKAGNKGFFYVMAKQIEASLKVKPKTHITADRIVQFFISGVVIYALGVFIVTGFLTKDLTAGLIRMAAVTAVACPCAWALSVPTAFAAAIGGLSSRGILVRGGTPLEIAGHAANVILDKTGTVTLAEPRVAGIKSFGLPEDELLQIAASIETGFNHPIANAIISHASGNKTHPLTAEGSEYLPGFGIKSSVKGRKVVIGSIETIKKLGMTVPKGIEIKGRATWIAIDGKTAGVIDIQDELREYSKNMGERLHDIGVKKVILATGDNEESEARRVANLIKSDGYLYGLKPDDKKSLVKELKTEGFTVMIGDGVNDAASLAAADVGISIGRTKADLAVKSSDIIVMRDDAASLIVILEKGKKLIRIIKENYAWAIGFNTIGIVLATVGILSPWLAALFHHISSVLVVLNSARLIRNDKTSLQRHPETD
ncbi:heavy metal translocating P-type ATPase [Desulfobacula toluolica]|uniref:P-type Zn(2+) transporter n=1 Tax=Desulfobacula toluolica (strain DSM 7467 / Tol2) TaxID=651182 RepID=K0NB09_DESTT|nr:cation-translocating P-type ATPase [Desulfobacula toluolica]CCK81439.1 predicted heavy metal translocating P-type ATPase [Desulfobacula toluolica Tol2]